MLWRARAAGTWRWFEGTLSVEGAERQMTVALRPGQTTRAWGKRDVDVVEILLHLHVAVAIRRKMRLLRASSILPVIFRPTTCKANSMLRGDISHNETYVNKK